jgi:hypothetical protein
LDRDIEVVGGRHVMTRYMVVAAVLGVLLIGAAMTGLVTRYSDRSALHLEFAALARDPRDSILRLMRNVTLTYRENGTISRIAYTNCESRRFRILSVRPSTVLFVTTTRSCES